MANGARGTGKGGLWSVACGKSMGSYDAVVGMTSWEECGYEYDLSSNLDMPVNRVNPNRAKNMANMLSEQKGFETCYDCTGSLADIVCTNKVEYADISDCPGYRIPTQSEMLRAIRPDTSKDFWTEDDGGNIPTGFNYICDEEVALTNTDATLVSSFAWYCLNADSTIHNVALLEPTAFGMFDLHGNLLEMTDSSISYGGYYASSADYVSLRRTYTTDFRCSATSFTFRLVRSAADSPPTKPEILVTPDQPVVDETDLMCTVTTSSIDPQGEDISYIFSFYVDGVLYEGPTATTYLEGDTVLSEHLTTHQVWTCEATPFDGTLYGETVSAPNFVEPYIRGACILDECDFGITLNAKDDVGIDFVQIPAGQDPLERYELTYDFLIQTRNVSGDVLYKIEGYYYHSVCQTGGYNAGITRRMSWHQMAKMTNTLSEQEGFETCYDCESVAINAYCQTKTEFVTDGIHTCEGYRLPTHAEYEYAQRSGSNKDFWTPYGGADLLSFQTTGAVLLDDGENTPLQDYVSCRNNTGSSDRLPNGFGVYDINGYYKDYAHDTAGCDVFPDDYSSTINPVCELSDESAHIFVGGYYQDYPYQVVNGMYSSGEPDCSTVYSSFRMARTLFE